MPYHLSQHGKDHGRTQEIESASRRRLGDKRQTRSQQNAKQAEPGASEENTYNVDRT